ncbi:MAG: glycoside hydrolase family 3 protein [Gemmatimonadetes bacterium]|nr:glycoside hydrolase family 3 protein [Gemmatimonadota bacterium]
MTLGDPGTSIEEAVGQMLMIGFRGDVLYGDIVALLRDIQPGGVVLFDYDLSSKGEVVRNITSPRQLRALTSALRDIAPYFIAVDVEGGYVNRLKKKYGFTVSVPSAQKLGRQSPGKTKKVAEALARELKEMGINWNFAPVVDVNIDPQSPAVGAIERSFSDVPRTVLAHANAFIKAHREQRVISTLKHFPGHGSAAGDTHLGVADVTETYRRVKELLPYQRFIQRGYGDPILTAHIVNRKLDKSGRPATLSHDIMTRLLRYEMGFDGVVISDDMQMGAIIEAYGLTEAVVEAVKAGVDMILLGNQIGEYNIEQVYEVKDAIVQAVADGVVGEDRICESFNRIQRLKQRFGI